MIQELFEEYFKHAKKLRLEEAERKLLERADILPSERMSHEQIKNCIRTLVAEKKKVTNSRRRRALLADMETELDEDEAFVVEEVDVPEDDAVITEEALFDLIHSMEEELFTNPLT